ncbi:uncharacterized protein LOC134565528 [Prinia subflava]|uniref:uncharacterized protein LOC134565528 n=1 Tax=Prinia subflava TaxID=208062 RepID=UPI002FE06E6A
MLGVPIPKLGYPFPVLGLPIPVLGCPSRCWGAHPSAGCAWPMLGMPIPVLGVPIQVLGCPSRCWGAHLGAGVAYPGAGAPLLVLGVPIPVLGCPSQRWVCMANVGSAHPNVGVPFPGAGGAHPGAGGAHPNVGVPLSRCRGCPSRCRACLAPLPTTLSGAVAAAAQKGQRKDRGTLEVASEPLSRQDPSSCHCDGTRGRVAMHGCVLTCPCVPPLPLSFCPSSFASISTGRDQVSPPQCPQSPAASPAAHQPFVLAPSAHQSGHLQLSVAAARPHCPQLSPTVPNLSGGDGDSVAGRMGTATGIGNELALGMGTGRE